MKRLFLLLALLCVAPAGAANLAPGIGAASCGKELRPGFNQCTVPAYTGPGDLVSGATFFIGLRSYTSAYAGNAFDVCDSATGLVCATATLSSGNVLSIPTISGLVCGSTITCVISKVYDQTGNANDFIQTVNANRPAFSTSCTGITAGKPCAVSTATTWLCKSASPAVSQPWTMYGVAIRTTGTALSFIISNLTAGNVNVAIAFRGTANQMIVEAETTLASVAATDNQWHTAMGIGNGASSVMYSDAVAGSTANIGAAALINTKAICWGNDPFHANGIAGNILEAAVWPSALTSGNATSLHNNAKAYWGY